MKKLFMVVFLLWGTVACSIIPMQLPSTGAAKSSSTPVVKTPEQRLFDEAQLLSAQVAKGALSRTAVADRLGALRLELVGRNAVDDDVFALYRQIAVRRDAGKIEAVVAQQQMEKHLRLWLERWPQLATRPSRPAFTSFMLRLYGLPSLGK